KKNEDVAHSAILSKPRNILGFRPVFEFATDTLSCSPTDRDGNCERLWRLPYSGDAAITQRSRCISVLRDVNVGLPPATAVATCAAKGSSVFSLRACCGIEQYLSRLTFSEKMKKYWLARLTDAPGARRVQALYLFTQSARVAGIEHKAATKNEARSHHDGCCNPSTLRNSRTQLVLRFAKENSTCAIIRFTVLRIASLKRARSWWFIDSIRDRKG